MLDREKLLATVEVLREIANDKGLISFLMKNGLGGTYFEVTSKQVQAIIDQGIPPRHEILVREADQTVYVKQLDGLYMVIKSDGSIARDVIVSAANRDASTRIWSAQ